MFNNFIASSIFISLILYLEKKSKLILLIFFILLFFSIITLTKSFIIIIYSLSIILLIYSNLRKSVKKYLIILISFFTTIFFIVITHFIFSLDKIDLIEDNIFIVNTNFYELNIFDTNVFIYPTSYFYNKIASLEAFTQNIFFGVGIGNYNIFINELKFLNIHPNNFPSWDPHSTYFGELAEKGIIGIVSLLLIFVSSTYYFTKLRFEKIFRIFFLVFFFYIVIESINLDIGKFRHLWFFLSFLSFRVSYERTSNQNQNI